MGEIMTISRVTRDGRGLHYDLQVLQQPERARACGSGPKSSADRRPVDPPPVVQMKIFEGPTRETAKDITFAYNADFFLYANLHHARDMATGRAAAPSTPPVLTGSPVSSMILLDRPTEAGYFIFSDLSVRHEGRYFLTFSLLEEPKEERDMDADEPMSGTDEITGPDMCSARRHYSFRTTVQTDDFDVYSAKKFPGLQESTQLSRTVAEQGCRVRIRRDVRMRRREKGKGGKDVSARGEEYAQGAPPSERSTATIRGRSSSNASLERLPYPQELHRRPSGLEFAPPRPSFAASEPSANRHLTFGAMPQYPPHPRSVPASPSYPPPGAPYGHRPSYPYKPEQSPTQAYAHQPAAPAPREMYPQRVHATAHPAPPPLAPRLEPAMEPPQRPQDTVLPPISEFANGVAPQRKPSFTPQPIAPMPPRSQQQYQQKSEINSPFRMEHNVSPYRMEQQQQREQQQHQQHPSPHYHHKVEYVSPPPSQQPGAYAGHGQPPLLPQPSMASRKRTADEAFSASDYQRVQNGRRQDDVADFANFPWSEPRYERAMGPQIPAVFPSLTG
ncbi:hypothetical protein VSDG_01032 [Cytospora chrysosperma]|uniref:Velvet domain-containing protein n=1 Tax=Cytospora chrysosperma TaxID=252740 RepID=A0A423WL65_CYTCH|nr:hypothetical protein VSDG_01032 [Valsa sordida]